MKKESFLLAITAACLVLLSPSLHHNLQAEQPSVKAKSETLILPPWTKLPRYRPEINISPRSVDSILKKIEENNQTETITKLDLRGSGATDAQLPQLSKLTNLKSLDLSSTFVTGKGFLQLKNLKNLDDLKLSLCRNLSDVGMVHLKELKGLKRLVLSRGSLTNAGVSQLAEMNQLMELNFSADPSIHPDFKITHHFKKLVNLEKLTLSGFPVSSKGLVHLKGLSKLKKLDLIAVSIDNNGLRHIGELTQLEKLNILGNKFSSEGLRHLSRLTKLEELAISGSSKKGKGLIHLKKLLQLKALDISYTSLSGDQLSHLKELPKLEELDLSYVRLDGNVFHHFNGGGFANLKKLNLSNATIGETVPLRGLPKLKELNLHSTYSIDHEHINDEWLYNISELTQLEKLDISDNKITGRGLQHLKKLTLLQEINISGLEIVGSEMKNFQYFSNLRSLEFDRCVCSSDQLVFLEKLTKLESLKLPLISKTLLSPKANEELRLIDHDESNDYVFSDAGLVHLKGLKNLRNLELHSTKLNGSGLKHLSNLKNLRALRVVFGEGMESQNLKYLKHLENLECLGLEKAVLAENSTPCFLWNSKLKHLLLSQCLIKGKGIKCLEPLANLESLIIYDMKTIDADYSHLPTLFKVKTLIISSREMTDEDCQAFKSFPNLLHVKIGSSQMTGSGLQHLQHSKQLKMLIISPPYIVRPSNNRFTHKGLSAGLAKLTSLEYLSIKELQKGAGLLLLNLKGLKNLKTLFLISQSLSREMSTKEGFTRENYLKLKKVLPNCNINGVSENE